MSGKTIPGGGGSSPVMVGDSGAGGVAGLVPAPAAGDATKFLSGAGTWTSPAGSGDFVGPAASTDNAVVRFDGTTGKLGQNTSAVIISDTGGITTGASGFIRTAANGLRVGDNAVSGNGLHIGCGTTLTANRTLTISTGDANRALAIPADATISGTNTGDQASGGMAFTPAGNIVATDVQAAIVEVDAEKVAGPGSATDNALMRFDGTGGKTAQNSGLILDDSDNLTMPTTGTLTIPNAGLHLKEAANGTDDLIIAVGSALTADRTLTIIPGDADRSLTFTGNASISGTNTGDQTNISGNAATVTTNANLTGPITSTGNATAVAAQTGTGSVFVMQASPTLTTPNLGVPSAATLTNASGLPLTSGVTGTLPVANGGTGITSLGAGVATFLGTPTSANLAAAVSDETGSGALVFQTNATLVTPALGTPASAVLTNATGLPIATGVAGLATDVATFLADPSSGNLRAAMTDDTGSGALVFATSPALVTPDLGTPSAVVLTSATGLPLTTGVTGVLPHGNLGTGGGGATKFLREDSTYQTISGGGDALTASPLSQFAATTSAQLAGVISDETGSGVLVLATTPTLVTPILGVATATTINKVAITAPATSATLTIADGATLTVSANATVTNGTHSGTNTGDQTSVSGNAGTVTTNANLTGPITSTGNATAVASQTGTGSTFVMATAPTLTAPITAAGTASANTAPKQTSGTLNTTPEAGASEYDGKVQYFSPEASTRGYIPAKYIIRLTGTNTLTDTTSAQAIFDSGGNGAITLPVGAYRCNGVISVSAMSATSGNGTWSLAGTATLGSILIFNGGLDNVTAATGTQSGSMMVTAASPASALAAGTGTGMQLWCNGSFNVTGAGTVIPSIALVTGGVTPVVAIGSFFELECFGATSVQTVGPWS